MLVTLAKTSFSGGKGGVYLYFNQPVCQSICVHLPRCPSVCPSVYKILVSVKVQAGEISTFIEGSSLSFFNLVLAKIFFFFIKMLQDIMIIFELCKRGIMHKHKVSACVS